MANYAIVDPQPGDDQMRDNDRWAEWVTTAGTQIMDRLGLWEKLNITKPDRKEPS